MNQKDQLILLALLTSMSITAHAQEMENSDTIRSRYHQSPQLPDGAAFASTLKMMDHLNNRDPSVALAFVQQGMGFDPAEDVELSKELLAKFLSTHEEINAEVRVENRNLGCPLGVPAATGDEVYAIMEAISDTPDIIAARHLVRLKAESRGDVPARLDKWLQERKAGIIQVKYDYKQHYESRSVSADAKLAEFCNDLAEGADQ